MNERERYIKTLTFEAVDKIPLTPGYPRRSTLKRWFNEGLPEGVYFLDYIYGELGIPLAKKYSSSGFYTNFRMNPIFEEKVLSHENGHYIVQDWMGAVTEISDEFDYTYIRNAIDFVTRKWHSFPIKTPKDWGEMKKRYDHFDPVRLPENICEIGENLKNREFPVTVSVNGPFWQLREWMGMENLCMAFLDTPEFVVEMIDFWCEFVLKVMNRFLPIIQIDNFHISEDMAFKAHSMLSPEMTRRFLQPVYEKWIKELKKFDIPVIDMDSDGYIEELIPIWIDAGINVCDPVEVAAHNDIVKFRKRFGTKMAYTGGIDKRAIAAGGKIMQEEVLRVVPPLLSGGGFIPCCDHGVPPDISLENFMEYTKLLAKLTGWI